MEYKHLFKEINQVLLDKDRRIKELKNSNVYKNSCIRNLKKELEKRC